jgi:anion-transporting  ArsA/GET3 family ATPase
MSSRRCAAKSRLVIVTGKGGVGKSSVACALGVAAAQRGAETIVAELAGRFDVARALRPQAAATAGETALAPRLWHVSIDPRGAMEDYLRHEVPGRVPGAVLSRSRAFDALAMAAPGLRELFSIGKVWELAQRPRRDARSRRYDQVILDAPASGHAIGLLTAPRTFAAIARIGPIARQAAAIDAALRDRTFTSVIGVSLAEQMAVSETLALNAALADELGVKLAEVVINRVLANRFSAAELRSLEALNDDPAVRAARWFGARARAQRAQVARMRKALKPTNVRTLPSLVDEGEGQGGEPLARALAHRLR